MRGRPRGLRLVQGACSAGASAADAVRARGLIFGRLPPSPEKGRGTRPTAVRTCTNVAGRRDAAALVKEPDPLFGGVADLPADDGPKARDASFCPTSRGVGRVLAPGIAE
ncbi:hypothetical protein [Nocardiopsis sp. RV163]|uniref:hypothetical protein n=1 Tax=Nocardiopsis sp. RV163 TaxID=1661388 RepID=UPI00064C2137|nr:hypothetical protein [Nocardiopsis sp. RV163]